MGRIIRVIMCKIPSEKGQQDFIELYRTMGATAVKDKKPYIVSLTIGVTYPDERSKGFNVVGKTEFKDLDDMKYYEIECEAHQKMKARAHEVGIEDYLLAYHEPAVEVTH
ncbi:hypothetical protein IFR04_008909 [Cadophora malorum]|uniref:Stress-response A/B barrel domain-containing protein n=1 Tax=Cadophora malorum TaxID=108018 RepID=A0A8H7W799_9HELO|nr:hypothetical protein IFR04_008909 [Cadophora malorum]